MTPGFGTRLGLRLESGDTLPFIGVYDVLSAAAAAKHFDGLLVSPSAFAASHYGITDVGFMAWSEIATFVRRLRALFPDKHIVVDLDNGCGDTDVVCHAASLVEKAGASGVILGDRDRPSRREIGDGVMSVDAFAARLARVLTSRRDLFVIARTAAPDIATIAARIPAFAEAGADAVLADHAGSLGSVTMLASSTAGRLAVNQNDADDTASCSLAELGRAGVAIAIYANPCFAAAEKAIRDAVESLTATDGQMADGMTGSSYAVALAARATAQTSRQRRSYPWTAPAHVSAR